MKHFCTVLFLALYPTLFCHAQEAAAEPMHIPKVILQTGIGLEWFGETQKLFTLSIERPVKEFWHLGLLNHLYLPKSTNFFGEMELKSGFELGVFSKYFFHGRFSGHRTGLYIGPELRIGARKFHYSDDVFTPLPINPTPSNSKEEAFKILFRWGVQWQFKHASLELAAPFGMEYYKTIRSGVAEYRDKRFVLLPMLGLGIGI